MNSYFKDNRITLSQAADLVGGRLFFCKNSNEIINSFATSLVQVRPGDVFFPLEKSQSISSEIEQAARRGAKCVILTRFPKNISIPVILVGNTQSALLTLASEYKKRISPVVVAICAENSSNIIKRYLYSAISAEKPVYKSPHITNEIQAAKAILRAMPMHKIALFDISTDASGEDISELISPDITILSTKELSAVEISKKMKRGSLVIANGDIPSLVTQLKSTVAQRKIILARDNPFCDMKINNVRKSEQGGIFDLHLHRLDIIMEDIKIPMFEDEDIYAAAFAAAVGVSLGLRADSVKIGLGAYSNALR